MTDDELKELERMANPGSTIAHLCKELRAAREALRFYANMQDWGYDHEVNGDCDYGERARKALGEE